MRPYPNRQIASRRPKGDIPLARSGSVPQIRMGCHRLAAHAYLFTLCLPFFCHRMIQPLPEGPRQKAASFYCGTLTCFVLLGRSRDGEDVGSDPFCQPKRQGWLPNSSYIREREGERYRAEGAMSGSDIGWENAGDENKREWDRHTADIWKNKLEKTRGNPQ